MQCNETNQQTKQSDTGLLVFYERTMNKTLNVWSNLQQKITAKSVAAIWKRQKFSILQHHPVWHRRSVDATAMSALLLHAIIQLCT